MTNFDLAVRGATIVSEGGRAQLDVHISDGRIAYVGEPRDAREEIDATGLLVMPGMVETHAHLMDPGDSERESFPSGTSAAAVAGVTTVIEHTHSNPVRTRADLEAKVAHLSSRSYVDFALAAHAWPGASDEARELWKAGAAYFKFFTCSTHGIQGHRAADIKDWFEALSRIDAPCLVHCEDESLTADAELALKAAGRIDARVIVEWRNRAAEEVAVSTIGILSRITGARVVVAHCSSAAIVRTVEEARRSGANIAAESCPQYFLLREGEIDSLGPLRKFTPPARALTDDDEDEMWRALRSGQVAFISSDHAPSTAEQKLSGSLWQCHFGLPGLDTTTILLLDAAARGKIAYEDVVSAYSTRPAKAYGYWPTKGSLEPGADADLAIIDPYAKWKLNDSHILSNAGWSPYSGREVQGRVVRTILRGKTVAIDQTMINAAPGGQFLAGPGFVSEGPL